MPISDKYTQRLGLAELDVYLDTPDNDNTYFNINQSTTTMVMVNTPFKYHLMILPILIYY